MSQNSQVGWGDFSVATKFKEGCTAPDKTENTSDPIDKNHLLQVDVLFRIKINFKCIWMFSSYFFYLFLVEFGIFYILVLCLIFLKTLHKIFKKQHIICVKNVKIYFRKLAELFINFEQSSIVYHSQVDCYLLLTLNNIIYFIFHSRQIVYFNFKQLNTIH